MIDLCFELEDAFGILFANKSQAACDTITASENLEQLEANVEKALTKLGCTNHVKLKSRREHASGEFVAAAV